MRSRAPRRSSLPWPLVVAALLLAPGPGQADEVHVRGGGVIQGVIVDRTDAAVVIEAGPGRVTIPLSRVSRIVEAESSLGLFHERAAAIHWDDTEGLAGLARWAADHDLATYARHTWGRVLALDPENPEANQALGRVSFDGAWMSLADASRAQGLVRWNGEWVTAAEYDALLRQSEAEARAAADRRESELRVREAEARAREAEARAREAESYAEQAEGTAGGIPYWWVLSGGGGPWWVGGIPPAPGTTPPEHPVTRPHRRPPPRTPPSSIWAQPPRARPPAARSHLGDPGSGDRRGSSSGSSLH
jgi:hypothetical protein